MKLTTRAPFMPLAADVDDDRLERLAREKGVGTLERPTEIEHVAVVAKEVSKPVPSLSSDAKGATPRSQMKTVNLELPDYAWTELKIMAVQQQTSLRHVVMAALKSSGITIKDADMVEDGRRLR